MNKEQALQEFRDEIFLGLLEKCVDRLEAYYQENKDNLAEQFVHSFRTICCHIVELQASLRKNPIAFIHYSMLRTSIIDRSYQYLIEAYSEEWYGDSMACHSSYDASWAYMEMPSLLQQLEVLRRPYFQFIDSSDIERLLLNHVYAFDQFVQALARYAIPQAMKLPEIQQIHKANFLRVRVGEYKDISEDIYTEDRFEKDVLHIYNRLKQYPDIGCAYESFAGRTLTDGEYLQAEMRYADFSGSDLTNSKFRSCILFGSRWEGAVAQNADFSYSLLCDADFSRSDLRGSIFQGARDSGFREGFLRSPGLLGLRFVNANLEKCDFRGAQLYGADFQGANLRDALFSEQDWTLYNLSEQQANEIKRV